MLKGTLYAMESQLNGLDVHREFTVSSTISFYDLHVILQVLYEWASYHLHKFSHPGRSPTLFSEETEMDWMERGLDIVGEERLQQEQESRPIHDFFKKPKDMLEYHYDFGDKWIVLVRLRAIILGGPVKRQAPTNISGRRAPPPEDSRFQVEYALRSNASYNKFLSPQYVLPLNYFAKVFADFFGKTVKPTPKAKFSAAKKPLVKRRPKVVPPKQSAPQQKAAPKVAAGKKKEKAATATAKKPSTKNPASKVASKKKAAKKAPETPSKKKKP